MTATYRPLTFEEIWVEAIEQIETGTMFCVGPASRNPEKAGVQDRILACLEACDAIADPRTTVPKAVAMLSKEQ